MYYIRVVTRRVFQQSLNKFEWILVVIYISSKQQYKRIYRQSIIKEKKTIYNNNIIQVNDIVK